LRRGAGPEQADPETGESRAAAAFPTGQLLSKYGLLGFLNANALVVSLSPAFLKPENIANVLTQVAPLGIVVLGQTPSCCCWRRRSFGRICDGDVCRVRDGLRLRRQFHGPAIFAAAIALGVVVGLVNGVLVAKRYVSPFLATLATTIVLQGLRFLYTPGSPLPSAFAKMGTGRLLGVPVRTD
jgi:ribose/xylose/arabinose/galactoside ABC-type transport system permease subunit